MLGLLLLAVACGRAPSLASEAEAPVSVRSYRSSLSSCWTVATCVRRLAIAHGGRWNAASAPYDSNAAIEAAYHDGLDGVKLDVRVTADDVPVIAHSSPIELYESLDCYGRRIEEMTAAEVTGCHRFPSTTQRFQRLDDVLRYLRGRMVVQLTVKLPSDYARTISEVVALGAEDRVFLEVGASEFRTLVSTLPGSDRVYYLIRIKSASDLDALLDGHRNPRAFMFEVDPAKSIAARVAMRLHAAGVRAFTDDNSFTASERTLRDLYEQGFDVVSANATFNLVNARVSVNEAHAVSPP